MSSVADLWEVLSCASPFFVMAGPCVIESEEHVMKMARALKDIGERVGVPLVFKASFDKANRTSLASFRGPGLDAGAPILQKVRDELGMAVVTDVHESAQVDRLVRAGVDILQIPAFLCRQTDLLLTAGRSGRIVNVKKGQFASATTMEHAADKVRRGAGNPRVMLCERGNCFGYGDLVVDVRNLVRMRQSGALIVQDVTHSVQQPGGAQGGQATGGLRQFVPTVARAAVAVGVHGLFFEVHDDPDQALSDGPNSWPLDQFEDLLNELVAIGRATRGLTRPEAGLTVPAASTEDAGRSGPPRDDEQRSSKKQKTTYKK